jgi:hypothetical protein
MQLFGKLWRSGGRIGCGYILAQAALICVLLVFNGFVVRSLINLEWGEEVRISHAIQLIVPVAMIFLELWLLDLFFAGTTRNKT